MISKFASSSKLKVNLLTTNYKQFLYCFLFLKNFNFLLNKKGFFICDNIINIAENKIYLSLYILIQHFKYLIYKRKSKLEYKNFYNKLLIKQILFLFFRQLNLFNSNLIVCNMNILNCKIKNYLLKIVIKKFKKFKITLFSRRFNFFIDFLKLTTLILKQNISLNSYVIFISQIFKNITKRYHSRFINFLKYLFNILLSNFDNKIKFNSIRGLKCIIKGRLRGKDRASSSIIKVGNIPTQSLGKKIFYHKTHIYTLYGVYGLKM